MRGRIFPAVLAALALVLGATATSAQGTPRSNTTGLFLGLDLNASSIESDDLDIDRESGGGATLRIGYGFSRLFSLYLEGAAANIESEGESFPLAHGELGVRFHFGREAQAFIPYVDLGFTQRSVTADDWVLDLPNGPVQGELEVSGSGLSFGGGVLYFLNPNGALNLGLKFTAGEFDTVRFNNVSVSGVAEADATTTRINLGISWFPMSRR